ncbi:hypothetical protein Ddc_16055 [Ditylenchus destructor]|nr:hypothetical protein Ddc_16055 [Ditylenchus destructor]
MLIFITTLSLLFIHLNGRVGAVNCYAFESPKTPEAILRICPPHFVSCMKNFLPEELSNPRIIGRDCCVFKCSPETFMPESEHFYVGDLLCTNMTHTLDGKRVIDQTCCCNGDGCNF